MMEIIRFERVSKTFRRHTGPKLLRQHLRSVLTGTHRDRFYALKDISFAVPKGASLGICGTNGSGKSTLLSLVSGLARPDEGRIEVQGRIAALLELGSGFHPDLTGAENLQLNAALIGLSKQQTSALFDSIVEFSELGEFIEEPLRTYSSGMILRLAFSIAISIDPEVLVVDEILAVGDERFQIKCQDRLRELRRNGTTFVCVSHSMESLLELCDIGLCLQRGQIVASGPMSQVVDAYHHQLAKPA